MSLLRRVARRCETHDRPSYSKTRKLEEELGMEPSAPPDSLTDQFADPDLIDCGNSWCQRRR
ncbi:hypothetical protein IMX12_13280 [Streptomyces sp. Babs14]|uniref:hypothetical protein n=1 Tax=unclassified Streptomyces TaxID=2593676 RepID=UPI001C214CF0|nr:MULTISPECIES: hypothetical protein [unclassified Streptomyces]MBU8549781.1 hypothetical protein [Streptomyces sp. Osf17]MBU8556564.1 hypothetical protein [Streptomyces sp. Babs14]